MNISSRMQIDQMNTHWFGWSDFCWFHKNYTPPTSSETQNQIAVDQSMCHLHHGTMIKKLQPIFLVVSAGSFLDVFEQS